MPAAPDARRARFEDLYARHYGAVWAYLRRRSVSAADADDCAATTWLTIWRRLDAVPTEHELGWCYATARRVLANHRRGEDRRVRLVRRAGFERTDDAVRPPDPRADGVRAALDRLRTDDAELLRLQVWEELTVAEIAVVLGLAPATVSVRLHRARARLRRALDVPEVAAADPTGAAPGGEEVVTVQDPVRAGHSEVTAPDEGR